MLQEPHDNTRKCYKNHMKTQESVTAETKQQVDAGERTRQESMC